MRRTFRPKKCNLNESNKMPKVKEEYTWEDTIIENGHFVWCVKCRKSYGLSGDAAAHDNYKGERTEGESMERYGAPCPKCKTWTWGYDEARYHARQECARKYADMGDINTHPDERAIRVPKWYLHDEEWEERIGKGYILPDGAWYDPINGNFFGCTTIN